MQNSESLDMTRHMGSSAPRTEIAPSHSPQPQAQAAGAGCTIWLTGLPCAGKSTLALAITAELLKQGRPIEVLDGDVVRRALSPELGYDKKSRDDNVRRIAFVAQLLNRNGVCAIVAAVSPYRETREEARKVITNFIEVFVDAPLSVCEKRDVKGMYAKARAGSIARFTGVDDPYEPPQNPEVHLQTSNEPASTSANRVLDFLRARGDLERVPARLTPSEIAERLAALAAHR